MKTLIIVDLQNDFIPGGSLAVPGADAIITEINDLQHGFELVVATQDWHPPNHQSFASNHAGRRAFENILLEGLEQTLWPDHCVQQTRGAEFPPGLDTRAVEAVFRKGTDPLIDSYSAFYDNGRRKRTGLAGYLRDKGASELFFAGLAADICVYYTLRDALEEGFRACLIESASRPLDARAFEQVKKDLTARGARIVARP